MPSQSGAFFRVGLRVVSLLPLLCGPGWSHPALDALLEQIPSVETGTANRYSLTDVQYAMGVDLEWNPLLRRAAIPAGVEGAPTFTLVIGSRTGRIGTRLVVWDEAPGLHQGQIYVSESLLRKVFNAYPDFLLPGQEEEEATPTPLPELTEELAPPEEPPGALQPAGTGKIDTLLALLYPPKGTVTSASPAIESVTTLVVAELKTALESRGVQLLTRSANVDDDENAAAPADAIIALQIVAASPAAKTSFLVYDTRTPPDSSARSVPVPWGRVSAGQLRASRNFAEQLHESFVRDFGPGRSIGVRSGPFALLQGRRKPTVLANVGVMPDNAREEIRMLAEWIGTSIAEIEER